VLLFPNHLLNLETLGRVSIEASFMQIAVNL